MRTNILLLLCISAVALSRLSCTMSIAGGSSSTDNGKITGSILDKNGQPAPGTQVTLLPADYNPRTDTARLCRDTTDSQGVYGFDHISTGLYTVHALHLSQRTSALITGVFIDKDTTLVHPETLNQPGAVKVFLPDTVDTAAKYVYIKGTTISKSLYGGTLYTGGLYAIDIDSAPAALLPPLVLASKTTGFTPVILSSTALVTPGDTTIIGTDTVQKPIWSFPLIIGVTTATVNHYNGFNAIKAKISNQLTIINGYFNNPAVFEGVFKFYIDSMYEFYTPVSDEFNKPIGQYAMRVIYDQYGQSSLPYWKPANRIVYEAVNMGNGDDLFNDQTNRNFAWALGLARGCVGYTWITVAGSGNPVNGQPYTAIESIMSQPQNYTHWDAFSIFIINYYKNRFSIIPQIYNRAFPVSMGVFAASNTGQPVQNAGIDLFGIAWPSRAMSDTPIASGKTNSTGEFVFAANPFALASDTLVYGNFLIRAINNSDTAYTWLPINDPGNAWFANPDTLYRTKITF